MKKEDLKKAGEVPIHKINEEAEEHDSLVEKAEISEEEKLHQEVEALRAEIEKMKNDYARAYADMENTKKRIRADEEMARKYRIQSFASNLLPTLDNFERALQQEIPEVAQPFVKGVEMIYEELKLLLTNEGVKEIECLNQVFDPNYHQAVMTEAVDGVEKGIVLEVFQKGYLLKDRILRAAMVKVSA